MNPDRFTIKSQEAIRAAGQLAETRRNAQAYLDALPLR